MAEESNGHESPSRIDRIERAVEALIDGHERLLASQKELLRAQVIMSDNLGTLVATVNKMALKIDAHEDRIQALIDSQLRVDQTLEGIRQLLAGRNPE